MNVSNVTRLVNALSMHSESSVLQMVKDKDSYSIAVLENPSPATNLHTLECLKELAGQDRLDFLRSHPEIGKDIADVLDRKKNLTKEVVRKIFAGLLHLQREHFSNLHDGETATERFKKLIFIENEEQLEALFMGDGPTMKDFEVDKAKSSGKGLIGFFQRVFVVVQNHLVLMRDGSQNADIRDAEMETSRLLDREVTEGTAIHLSDGAFYVAKRFAKKGAFLVVLRDLDGNKPPKIVCRGTAFRKTATDGLYTGLNDVLYEIGLLGVQSIWPDLSQYLKDEGITSVEILGKSMGGSVGQALTVLIEGILKIKVEKLTTYCSVGGGRAVNKLFKREVLAERKEVFDLHVIRNGGKQNNGFRPKCLVDAIPAVGGEHLGEGTDPEKCQITLTYVNTGDGEVEVLQPDENIFRLGINFIHAFADAHCRQSTLRKFSCKKIEDRKEIDAHLRLGNRLEKIRMIAVALFHLIFWWMLSAQTFDAFYRQQKQLSQQESNRQPVLQGRAQLLT